MSNSANRVLRFGDKPATLSWMKTGEVSVIDLGGSLVAPSNKQGLQNGIDTEFLKGFTDTLAKYLAQHTSKRLIIVCGGGRLARAYQNAYRVVADAPAPNAEDWIGIAATHLNAELLRQLLSDWCPDEVVTDPTADIAFEGRVLIAAGWKPGFSTDYDAVLLAERFGARTLIRLSNIAKVYTADPDTDPNARPIDTMSWTELKSLVGTVWVPGGSSPFDPVATKYASEIQLRVIVASGVDMENCSNILTDKPFCGTIIGPE